MRDKKGKYLKGTGGRQPGAKNRIPSDIAHAFYETFEEVGGVKALAKWVKKNDRHRGVFYQIVSKLFPKNMEITATPGMTIEELVQRVDGEKPPQKTTEATND